MHEAGLAAAIATAVRDAGLVGRPVRVVVAGGHDEPTSFDAALRFHLEGALPEVDPSLLSIVHEPTDHWCPTCGRLFRATWQEPCPACGAAGMPTQLDETIAIEPGDGPGRSDPAFRAEEPSVAGVADAQAGAMEGSGAVSRGAPTRRPHDHRT